MGFAFIKIILGTGDTYEFADSTLVVERAIDNNGRIRTRIIRDGEEVSVLDLTAEEFSAITFGF